jgi:hypothetical protein
LSSNDDRNARYAEILKQIEQRKQQQTSAPIQSLLAAALDALNAAGLLTSIKRRPPADMSAYGPKTFNGNRPTSEGRAQEWVGSVMWHKPKGYQHFQILRLLGIWAIGDGRSIRLVIGEKRLTFNAPIFNPESYYHHIKRKFDLYYTGHASPPFEVEALIYDAPYDESKRLETRSALQTVLRHWIAVYRPDADAE